MYLYFIVAITSNGKSNCKYIHLANKFLVRFYIDTLVQCAAFDQIHQQISFSQKGCIQLLHKTILIVNNWYIVCAGIAMVGIAGGAVHCVVAIVRIDHIHGLAARS